MPELAPETKLSGGRVNYYLVAVDHPQREDQQAYQAECEDIIEALELNPDEANIFKEIWRSANARKGNGKPGHQAIYGAEKIVHYAGRILRRARRINDAQQAANASTFCRHIELQRHGLPLQPGPEAARVATAPADLRSLQTGGQPPVLELNQAQEAAE